MKTFECWRNCFCRQQSRDQTPTQFLCSRNGCCLEILQNVFEDHFFETTLNLRCKFVLASCWHRQTTTVMQILPKLLTNKGNDSRWIQLRVLENFDPSLLLPNVNYRSLGFVWYFGEFVIHVSITLKKSYQLDIIDICVLPCQRPFGNPHYCSLLYYMGTKLWV